MRRKHRRQSHEEESMLPMEARRENSELAHEMIAHRAYELFEKRGREPGRDLEDWFEAERELLSEERRLAG